MSILVAYRLNSLINFSINWVVSGKVMSSINYNSNFTVGFLWSLNWHLMCSCLPCGAPDDAKLEFMDLVNKLDLHQINRTDYWHISLVKKWILIISLIPCIKKFILIVSKFSVHVNIYHISCDLFSAAEQARREYNAVDTKYHNIDNEIK